MLHKIVVLHFLIDFLNMNGVYGIHLPQTFSIYANIFNMVRGMTELKEQFSKDSWNYESSPLLYSSLTIGSGVSQPDWNWEDFFFKTGVDLNLQIELEEGGSIMLALSTNQQATYEEIYNILYEYCGNNVHPSIRNPTFDMTRPGLMKRASDAAWNAPGDALGFFKKHTPGAIGSLGSNVGSLGSAVVRKLPSIPWTSSKKPDKDKKLRSESPPIKRGGSTRRSKYHKKRNHKYTRKY
jgi:hypothetical protein